LETVPEALGEDRCAERGTKSGERSVGWTYSESQTQSESESVSESESESESEVRPWKEHVSPGQGTTETQHNTEMLILYWL
jgi:hypothetical protein